MERHIIDLNKQDFDLNEVPLCDLNVSSHDGFSSSSPPPLSSPHSVHSTVFYPKKGGWLELFQNMFTQDAKTTSMHRIAPNGFQNKNPCYGDMVHMDGHHMYACGGSKEQSKKSVSSLVGKRKKLRKQGNVPLLQFGDQVSEFFLQSGLRDGLILMSHPPFEACSTSTMDHCQLALMNCSGNAPHFAYPLLEYNKVGLIDNDQVLHNGCNGSKMPLDLDLNSYPPFHSDKEDPVGGCSRGFSKDQFDQVTCHSLEKNNCDKDFLAQGLNGSRSCNDSTSEEPKCYQRDGSVDSAKVSESILSDNSILERIVKVIESPDWLPPGWVTELKTRKAGTRAGTSDKYFKDPVTGRRFRSKNEVVSFLQREHRCEIHLFGASAPVAPDLLLCQNQLQGLPEDGICPDNFHDINGCRNVPNLDSYSATFEKLSVKQEEQDETMRDEQTESAVGVMDSCEMHVQTALRLGVSDIRKHDHTILQLNEESEWLNKRQKISHSLNGQTSEPVPFRCKEIEGRDDSAMRWNNETKEGINGLREAGLLEEEVKQRLEVHGQDRDRTGLQPCCAVKYNSNGNQPFFCQAKIVWNASSNKLFERKIQRLTLKQEREVLISLGRKCCLRFLSSTVSVSERAM